MSGHNDNRSSHTKAKLTAAQRERTNQLEGFSSQVQAQISGAGLVGAEPVGARSQAELSATALRAIVGNMTERLFVFDHKGNVILMNAAACKAYGAGEPVPRRVSEMFESIDVIELDGRRLPLAEWPVSRVLRGESISSTELRVCSKANRKEFIFSYSGAPILDTSGHIVSAVLTCADITDRKLAEQRLHQSEERFRLVVEGAPVGMYIQTDGLFRYLNPAALNMFGAKQAELFMGNDCFDMIHPDYHAAVKERVRLLREQRTVVPFRDERYVRLDGTDFEVEVTAIPFVFEGREGAIVFFRDITERKLEENKRAALEQQLGQAQRMEAVGRLAGGVAHDFNNILMVIQSYAEMLQDGPSSDDTLQRNTQEIMKAASRAAGLTRQLLAFSRKQITLPCVLDLNAVINETAKMLKRLIGEDIELSADLADPLWPIEADPDQIVQVLMNLCVNARDAMPVGGTLTIRTENVSIEGGRAGTKLPVPPGEYVKLSIADTGTGMSKEIQDRIFDPFFTTKEVGKGTGLGLATVYGIVKNSGGYVWVDSEPGQGACFTVYLTSVKGTFTLGNSAESVARPSGTETVLVAEDEDALREALCDHLRGLGYTVLAASSGREALLVTSRDEVHIDLLLTDVVMPLMSGRELSQTLERSRPYLKTIYMSGYTDDAVLRHGIHKMGAAFLQKPFSLGTLSQSVRNTLDRVAGAPDVMQTLSSDSVRDPKEFDMRSG